MSDWNPALYMHFAAELQDLTESEQQHFLERYHQMLEEQYPLQENGQILLAFPRLFVVARRTE